MGTSWDSLYKRYDIEPKKATTPIKDWKSLEAAYGVVQKPVTPVASAPTLVAPQAPSAWQKATTGYKNTTPAPAQPTVQAPSKAPFAPTIFSKQAPPTLPKQEAIAPASTIPVKPVQKLSFIQQTEQGPQISLDSTAGAEGFVGRGLAKGFNTISSTATDYAKKVKQVYLPEKPRNAVQTYADISNAVLASANLLFTPVSAGLSAAEEVPVLGTAAKGANAAFQKVGEIGSWGSEKLLNAIPDSIVSKESKQILAGPVSAWGSFAAMMAVGGALHEAVIGKGGDIPELKAKAEEIVKKTSEAVRAKEVAGEVVTPDTAKMIASDVAKKVELPKDTGELAVKVGEDTVKIESEQATVLKNLIKNQEDLTFKVNENLPPKTSRFVWDFTEQRGTIESATPELNTGLANQFGTFIDRTVQSDISAILADSIPEFRDNSEQVTQALANLALENLKGNATNAEIGAEMVKIANEIKNDFITTKEPAAPVQPPFVESLSKMASEQKAKGVGGIMERLANRVGNIIPKAEEAFAAPKIEGTAPTKVSEIDVLTGEKMPETKTGTPAGDRTQIPRLEGEKPVQLADKSSVNVPEKTGAVKVEPKQQLVGRVAERMMAEHPEMLKGFEISDGERIRLKDQAEKALNLIEKDPKEAMKRALLSIDKGDITPNAISVALREKALQEGDNAGFATLVKAASLELRRKGQDIATEAGSVSDTSTSHFVKQLISDRLAKLEKISLSDMNEILGGKKKSAEAKGLDVVERKARQAKKNIGTKRELSFEKAQALLDKLACK